MGPAILLTIAVLGGSIGASACSGDDKTATSDSVSGTTQVGVAATDPSTPTSDPAATSTTNGTDDSVDTTVGANQNPTGPPATADSTLPQASAVDVTTSVYWIRPAGGEPRSIPGYTDPDGQPTPLLVYGSATNNGGGPVAKPTASALWKAGDGEVRYVTVASLRNPDGTSVSVLEPGQSVDVWVIVSGDSGSIFGDLTPEFVVAAA